MGGTHIQLGVVYVWIDPTHENKKIKYITSFKNREIKYLIMPFFKNHFFLLLLQNWITCLKIWKLNLFQKLLNDWRKMVANFMHSSELIIQNFNDSPFSTKIFTNDYSIIYVNWTTFEPFPPVHEPWGPAAEIFHLIQLWSIQYSVRHRSDFEGTILCHR